MERLTEWMDGTSLYAHVGISVALWLLVVAAVLVDLWDGVYTAKVLRQRVHSHKLRVTVNKLGEYWRIMLLGFVADTIGVFFPFYTLPYLSVVFCLGLIGIEVKSVWEHIRRRKTGTEKLGDIVKAIVECAGDKDAQQLLKRISDYITSEGKK